MTQPHEPAGPRPSSDAADHAGYDVVVVGGGAAGVSAAIGAVQTGARTLLIERASVLGGAATLRNVLTFCGLYTCETSPRQAVAGVAALVLDQLRERNGVSDTFVIEGHDDVPTAAVLFIDPEAVQSALDTLLASAGVDLLLAATVVGAQVGTGQVDEVSVTDFAGNRLRFRVGAVVDATGDASVASLAGAAITHGVDGRFQTATLGARYGGVAVDADIGVAAVGRTIRQAQARGNADLSSSTGYVARLPISGDVVTYLADEDVDATDAIAYTRAIQHARGQAWAYLRVLRRVPGWQHAYLVSTGPELGIRESRHMVARVPLRAAVLERGIVGADTVALGAWPSEYHGGAGQGSVWKRIGGDLVYGIALDSLRSVTTPNLFAAGRVLGGDRVAAASARVMGTAFATGQAAGVAAACLVSGNQRTDLLTETRNELSRQGALLALPHMTSTIDRP